uniref:Uncharacterized protein n=1 Tax=Spongospora subterranea TaxID=70186 RepID=A0A0H5RP60_9EUKA|eukprot:CRZ10514.1 hypothetical protein [Spongospora subterranea]
MAPSQIIYQLAGHRRAVYRALGFGSRMQLAVSSGLAVAAAFLADQAPILTSAAIMTVSTSVALVIHTVNRRMVSEIKLNEGGNTILIRSIAGGESNVPLRSFIQSVPFDLGSVMEKKPLIVLKAENDKLFLDVRNDMLRCGPLKEIATRIS